MNFSDFKSQILESINILRNWRFVSKRYSMKFSNEEYFKISNFLSECNCRPSDFYDIEFFWNDEMRKDVVACWTVFKPNSIFVSNSFHFDVNKDGFKKLIAPIAHELRHRKQFMVLSIIYIILSVPIIRNFTLEIDANNTTAKVNRHFKIEEGEWL